MKVCSIFDFRQGVGKKLNAAYALYVSTDFLTTTKHKTKRQTRM
ncbi:hypothetical protein LMG7974_01645 [Campylobacter majalis]|uniref:Uncharacterized protein n=1 Tax=Campylobacter majalis TaxID=2790656 RepID=A0ABN7KC77_9BACT|nr:hypothetical protein LMG7974_01645 [Campylobacter majalis]